VNITSTQSSSIVASSSAYISPPVTDLCTPNPCQNGGSCRVVGNNLVNCNCRLGFTGRRCENEIIRIDGNVTITNPRVNGKVLDTTNDSVKRDLANMFSDLAKELVQLLEPELTTKFNSTRGNIEKVTITSFRVGSLIADFTISFTNAFNVSLKVLEQEYLASLNGSVIGSAAEVRLTDYNECATGQYCGANAICKNTIGSFTCTCKSGYTGDGVICVKKDDAADYRILAIVLTICLLFLLILLLLLILLIRRRRRTKKEEISEFYFLESTVWQGDPKMRAKKVEEFAIDLQKFERHGSEIYSYT